MNEELNNNAVFLITIDALRPDHLKKYGYHRNTAPNLEKFVENGITFLNAITNGPETPSSFSTIFTSILPFLKGGYSPLPSHKIIFPQILEENGIFTYGIHSNPNLGRYFNYNRGFNIFLDGERYKTSKNNSKELSHWQIFIFTIRRILNYKDLIKKLIYHVPGFNNIKNWLRKKIPFITDLLLPFTPIAYNAPYIISKIISFLNHFKGNFFLWAHFMDIHSPYNPPKENVLRFMEKDVSLSERSFLNKIIFSKSKRFVLSPKMLNKLKVLYDAQINYLDNHLIKLFSFINSRFKKNCLIIFTADHGESFFEHGYSTHQGNVYDELLKVPLFIIKLGKKHSVKKISNLVQLIDIPPTILDYFDIKIPDYFQGKSLLPLIHGKSLKTEKYIITEGFQMGGRMKRNNKEGFKLISIRTVEWKYIFDEEKKKEFLFNLKSDPGEKINLVSQNMVKLSEFRKVKDEHLQEVLESGERLKILKTISTLDFNEFKI